MSTLAPHYWLLTETQDTLGSETDIGLWRFVLQQIDGAEKLEASDCEQEIRGERLQLLAVIRGLEALDQPSHVTIVPNSTYVVHGIRRGLTAWRESNWQWECFGRIEPVRNRDLWQRFDRAAGYHTIICRQWKLDRLTSPYRHRRSSSPTVSTERSATRPGDSAVHSWIRSLRRRHRPASAQFAGAGCA